ncbi:MAG: hypothetical protein LBQ67_04655 [Treponema sp.]|jgi:hypothetical protein|nr:hypothetical protein [Treponema sp.]
MNRRQSHIFWGSHAPLYTLAGAGLIITASSRLAFAIICAGALIWVYGLTSLVYCSSQKIMPLKGKPIILLFLSSFVCSIYILCMFLINPLMIMGTCFFLLLVPPCCMGSGIFTGLASLTIEEVFFRSLLESLVLGGLIIAMSLIREPLGLGSVSFPGGAQGMIELTSGDYEGFFPIRIFAISAGALLILGYGVSLFRYFRGFHTKTEDNQ